MADCKILYQTDVVRTLCSLSIHIYRFFERFRCAACPKQGLHPCEVCDYWLAVLFQWVLPSNRNLSIKKLEAALFLHFLECSRHYGTNFSISCHFISTSRIDKWKKQQTQLSFNSPQLGKLTDVVEVSLFLAHFQTNQLFHPHAQHCDLGDPHLFARANDCLYGFRRSLPKTFSEFEGCRLIHL